MKKEQLAALHQCIRHLVTAVSNADLYSPAHQQVARLAGGAHASLLEAMTDMEQLTVMVIEEQLVVEDSPLPANLYFNRFVQLMKGRGIQFLRFGRAITLAEITALVVGLSRSAAGERELANTANVRYGKIEIRYTEVDGVQFEEGVNPLSDFGELSAAEFAKFREIYEGIRKNRKISAVGLYDIVSGFIRTFKQEADALLVFAPIRAMDHYTFTHSTNVCILNLAQAMALGIEGPMLHDIGIAAMLHDIGKLFIPEDILSKQGGLTEEEWQIVRQHPLKGALHLLDTPGVPRLAVVTAYEHHMKYDFSGYPKVSAGWQQNLCSQMTAISDAFDAIRTTRSYSEAKDWDYAASALLALAGTGLHPFLTRNFLTVVDSTRRRQTGEISRS